MAARRGIQLDEGHARRVAAGEVTLAALAAEIGVTRQTLHAAFLRRGWLTTAKQQLEKAEIPARPPAKPVERQRPAQALNCPPVPNHAPAPALAPPAAIIWPAATDTAEIARLELANVALLTLAQLRDSLAGQRLGPAALKSAAQAAQLVADVLDRAGVPISQVELPALFELGFEEISEAECRAIQEHAELDYHGAFASIESNMG